MVPAIRRRSRPRVGSTTTRRAIRRSRCRAMGPWIGPRIQGSAAIIRIAMSVKVSTAQEDVMPAFGTNRNVMCYIEDIFVYLRARANDAVSRGRPQKHEDKPEAATQVENSCLGLKN